MDLQCNLWCPWYATSIYIVFQWLLHWRLEASLILEPAKESFQRVLMPMCSDLVGCCWQSFVRIPCCACNIGATLGVTSGADRKTNRWATHLFFFHGNNQNTMNIDEHSGCWHWSLVGDKGLTLCNCGLLWACWSTQSSLDTTMHHLEGFPFWLTYKQTPMHIRRARMQPIKCVLLFMLLYLCNACSHCIVCACKSLAFQVEIQCTASEYTLVIIMVSKGHWQWQLISHIEVLHAGFKKNNHWKKMRPVRENNATTKPLAIRKAFFLIILTHDKSCIAQKPHQK